MRKAMQNAQHVSNDAATMVACEKFSADVGKFAVAFFKRFQPPMTVSKKQQLSPAHVGVLVSASQNRPAASFRKVNLPKRDLVSVLQVLFQTGRLRIAPDLELASTLTTELTNFTARITPSFHETFACWRESQHDDLVLALSIACWYFERMGRIQTFRLIT
jgi:hypothetical protein